MKYLKEFWNLSCGTFYAIFYEIFYNVFNWGPIEYAITYSKAFWNLSIEHFMEYSI